MPVDSTAMNKSEYKDKTYYFCTGQCKKRFDENPERALEVLRG